MEIIILRDGEVYARARAEDGDDGVYTILTMPDADMPQYPAGDPGIGKTYELGRCEGELRWLDVDRPLTIDERLSLLEASYVSLGMMQSAKHEGKAVGEVPDTITV